MGRVVNFVPLKAVGIEVAKGILNASQTAWPIRTLNLGKHDVCIEAGTTLGHIEIQDKECHISCIRVPEQMSNERNATTRNGMREEELNEMNGRAKAEISEREQALQADAGREQILNESEESHKSVGANLMVPGILDDPRLGPVSGVVTRDRGGRPSGEPETPLGCGQPQPGELRSPSRHAERHTLKVKRSSGEVGEVRSEVRVEDLNEKESENDAKEVVGEEPDRENQMRPTGPTERILLSERRLSTAVEVKHVDANGLGRSGVIAQVQNRTMDEALEGTVEPAKVETIQETERFETEGNEPSNQHDWDEAAFRRVAETTLLNQGIVKERQRDQLMEILIRFKELWIARSLGQVDFDYDVEIPTCQPAITLRTTGGQQKRMT